jgi:hypothetical protein
MSTAPSQEQQLTSRLLNALERFVFGLSKPLIDTPLRPPGSDGTTLHNLIAFIYIHPVVVVVRETCRS